MRVVVDKNNPLVGEAFRQFGEVQALGTKEITKEALRDADIVIIRSETKVTKELLDGSKVKFVGTATIGTDHVDLEYLSSHGIGFASAPGSNANSVAEYFVSAVLTLAKRKGFTLAGKTLGVVGVGNVGSKVVRNAKALGMNVLKNDPPLARATADPSYVPINKLMGADIITLHVPFTKSGNDPTYHLINDTLIRKMNQGTILFNTARGAVVDGEALKAGIERKHLGGALLDVWEGEPLIDTGLMKMVDVATSHIAGYSFDGKLAAVNMTYSAACKFFGVQATWTPRFSLPKPAVERIVVQQGSDSNEEVFRKIVCQCYDIEFDDRALRSIANVLPEERRPFFARLRAEYRVRREFFTTVVELPPLLTGLAEPLRTIGFRVEIGRS
ncbi:MAG: 4-phosphoerythronate dehydrogenase [Bacteroidota bacterium]